MSLTWGAGLHTTTAGPVDASAYWQYIGRWSARFVTALLAAAEIGPGDRGLNVATGTGVAAQPALALVGESGLVVGVDISLAMLDAARARLSSGRFLPVVSDGQALVFPHATFGAVLCQLGLMFFPDPARGLAEFHRFLRVGRRAAVCVIAAPERAPMWGILAETLGRHLPEQHQTLRLSFALAEPARLEMLFTAAGFSDVRVTRETREGTVASFEEYWAPIEAGTGQMPQACLALPAPIRRAVRNEVRARLAPFELNGQLTTSVDMLIGTGRA